MDIATSDGIQACNTAPETPCMMAKGIDPQGSQAVADIKFNSIAKAAVFALLLVLTWLRVPPGTSPSIVLRNAASPCYDPRLLERTRLLLI